MSPMTLELTGQAQRPIETSEDLVAALEAVESSPYPKMTVADEWGHLIRAEGRSSQLIVEMRTLEGTKVRWVVIGRRPPTEVKTPFHLLGNIRKVKPSELLNRAEALDLIEGFRGGRPLDPAFEARPLDEEDGGMVVLAAPDREPRPVGSWLEVERYAARLPENGIAGFALSRPDRTLLGVLGDGRSFAIRFRQSRGPIGAEHRIARFEKDPTPRELQLEPPQTFPADQLIPRTELLGVLESLYRFEEVPPGFRRIP